jgi:antitoxin component of RelBE/YafQ-DinJ toxin-antitoxin module
MKDQTVRVRVTVEIKAEIETEAAKLGLTVSAYLVWLHRQHRNKG